MKRFTGLIILVLPALALALTVGQGPAVGTDKRGVTWYQEFQDWGHADVRALDVNADVYTLNGHDPSRDLVAFYSRDEGTNYFFRVDVFDLEYQVEGSPINGLDVYLLIDCAAGGQTNFPDGLRVNADPDHPWELAVKVYDSVYHFLDAGTNSILTTNFPAYWRSDLDGVEFSIPRSYLINKGWNGAAPPYFQVVTAKDFSNQVFDAIGSLTRGTATSNGWLFGSIVSTSTTGRAKYAAIAHANQSVATINGTQTHIFTNRPDLNLYPGFVRLLDSAEMFDAPVNLHVSGTLLMSFLWAAQNPGEIAGPTAYPNRDGPAFLNRMKNFVTTGPGSLIGGVLAEHIMPYFEGDVNQKSIQQNSELIYRLFGLTETNMGVMHVPERVIRSQTNNPHVSAAGPLDGKTFEDIAASGFQATYLDEVSHLHWWFYPGETNNPGWDDGNCGRWAGGRGNDEEPYHHKIHKINGVYCFMINDREDQEKFGPEDGGMQRTTRHSLLRKAMDADSAQITIVFDDWEAYAGNSFASSTPNGNADQFHQTLRWAANHPWIEMVNLKQVLEWALADTNWVIDHGYTYNQSSQTYEYLKRSSEQDYDHWYYGTGMETSFFDRVPSGAVKKYGDLNTTNTLIRDSWDCIQQITSTNLKTLAEWSYSAMIYETAWHDEDANPDQYKSRNYQVTFDRTTAQGNCDDSYADTTGDNASGWALRLHAHVRDMGVLKAASDWVASIKNGAQGPDVVTLAADLDDDASNEFVLCNNKVFLCFEKWGARLIKAFIFDGSDAIEVVGAPITNPAEESDVEGADNNRCSAFKDRYCTGQTNIYTDMDFGPGVQGSNSWLFTSADGRIAKRIWLERGRDVVRVDYTMSSQVGQMFTRYGLGPNQLDIMLCGQTNLAGISDATFRGLKNSQGGEAYVVAGHGCALITGLIVNAGWNHRELPLVEQFETFSTATNWGAALAFSESSARDLDGDGLNNTNEISLGTDYERADTDGDGMPDGYEIANSLNALGNDGNADNDGDGVLNRDEYIGNTLANHSNSFLRVTNILGLAASVRVTHPVSPPRQYAALFSDSLNGPWQSFLDTNSPVGTWLETNGSVTSHTFTDDFTVATTGGPPTNGQRFYTIGVSVP